MLTRRLAAAFVLLTLVASCDALGNPPLEREVIGRPTVSRSGLVLVSRALCAPSPRAAQLARRLRPDVVDPRAAEFAFVALVEVAATNAPYVRGELVTHFVLVDGSTVERRWPSSTRRTGGVALFGVPVPVREVSTTLE